jgi:hypothetical protein
VVLVGHDAVEANLISEGILVMVLIVEKVGFLGVEIRVGEAQASGVVLREVFVPDVAIGLLGEPIDL